MDEGEEEEDEEVVQARGKSGKKKVVKAKPKKKEKKLDSESTGFGYTLSWSKYDNDDLSELCEAIGSVPFSVRKGERDYLDYMLEQRLTADSPPSAFFDALWPKAVPSFIQLVA